MIRSSLESDTNASLDVDYPPGARCYTYKLIYFISMSNDLVVVDNKQNGQAVYVSAHLAPSEADALFRELYQLPREWWTTNKFRGKTTRRMVMALSLTGTLEYSDPGKRYSAEKPRSGNGPLTPVCRPSFVRCAPHR
jgi:hypothetical protein